MDSSQLSEKAQRDYQLVLAAREKGDERAYAELMGFYREPIYLMMLRMTHNPADADDLTLETFGKAFCQLHTFTPQYSFATWLFTIASNRGLDFLRRQHMDTIPISDLSVSDDDQVYEYPIPSNDDNPEETLIGKQRAAIIRQVVEQLPPRYRRIIKLRYYEDMSYEQIAQELHIPLGTMKIQLRRARQLLAQIAKKHLSSL
jgi:RNA polymerase sigma-70 factor (ECF subfamily)